ncbi:MAG: hypothetical protein LBN95_12705 [Prevotellaceae bacterium]|jgi:hypothetical protein|nr:hypothetical protein [Prevotellaceae bacterium]
METIILRYNINDIIAISILNSLKKAGVFEVYEQDIDFSKIIDGKNQFEAKQIENNQNPLKIFSKTRGMWADYNIDGNTLRNEAWNLIQTEK